MTGNEIYQELKRKKNNLRPKPNIIDISFNGGARVTISGRDPKKYRVRFLNMDTGGVEYETVIYPGMFASPYKKYFVNWKVIISDEETREIIREEEFDTRNKLVYIDIDSQSIGDTIAWIPHVKRFEEKNKCKILIKTFHNDLFKDQYPEWVWVYPGKSLPPHYASCIIGYFLGDNKFEYTRKDPRLCSLGEVICQIINIPYVEERPRISIINPSNPSHILEGKDYVCICTESTAGAKYWHHNGGWQDLVDMIKKEMNIDVVVIQKNSSNLNGVIDLSGNYDLRERAYVISRAKSFIGLPSGMSWLAWALKVPVVMISGFSEEWCEFTDKTYRVTNKSVCNGCWNKTEYTFDKGDWWWCPVHKGTDRNFECTRTITTFQVFSKFRESLGFNI